MTVLRERKTLPCFIKNKLMNMKVLELGVSGGSCEPEKGTLGVDSTEATTEKRTKSDHGRILSTVI
jgi:hypothetical protein